MGWLVGARALPKSRATSRYAHPPPSFQLSNPLPNSPGTPTHLGHPHGQLSLSTLVHQSPQVHQPLSSFEGEALQKFETAASLWPPPS